MAKKAITYLGPKIFLKILNGILSGGLIDTDGTMMIDNPKRKGRLKLLLGYTTACLSFGERLRDELGSKRVITKSRKVMNGKEFFCYGFKLGGADSVRICGDIYKDSDGMRNEEKYRTYIKGCELYAATKLGCYICGNPVHTRNVCTEHMHAERKDTKPKLSCKECDKPVYSEKYQLCQAHYHRKRRHDKAEEAGRITFAKSTFGVSREFGAQTSVAGLVDKIKKKRIKKKVLDY